MSQEVMNELVNMSQEIIKLKDQKRELLDALKEYVSASKRDGTTVSGTYFKACAAISKAEGEKA